MTQLKMAGLEIAMLVYTWGAAAADPLHPAASPQLNLQEELIGEKSPEALSDPREDIVSPDGARVAWLDKRGRDWVVKVNGVADGPGFDEVTLVHFSPDSQHLVYWARRGKTWTLLIDQKEKGAYSESGSMVAFSPDGTHYAYAHHSYEKGEKSFVVSESQKGPGFDQVEFPTFSPKSQRLVYTARRGKTWIIVDNGQEIPCELPCHVRGFTPKEELILVQEESGRGTKVRYVIGSETGAWFDAISSTVVFDDQRVAYAGAKIAEGGWLHTGSNQASGQIVMDGRAGLVYKGEDLPVTYGLHAADQPRWANIVDKGRQYFSAPRYGVSAPIFSPDGGHLAYVARVANKHYIIMLDGREADSFEYVPCNPAFGLDSTLYYAGFRAGEFVVAANGKTLNELAIARNSDYDRYSCAVNLQTGAHWTAELSWWTHEDPNVRRGRLIVDGRAGPEQVMGDDFQIQFSGDEFHTVYKVDEMAKGKRPGRSYVVLDGKEGKSYDQIIRQRGMAGRFPQTLHFSGEGAVTFVARSGRDFIRVTQSRSPIRP